TCSIARVRSKAAPSARPCASGAAVADRLGGRAARAVRAIAGSRARRARVTGGRDRRAGRTPAGWREARDVVVVVSRMGRPRLGSGGLGSDARAGGASRVRGASVVRVRGLGPNVLRADDAGGVRG